MTSCSLPFVVPSLGTEACKSNPSIPPPLLYPLHPFLQIGQSCMCSSSTGNCLLFNTALQPQAKKLRVRDGTTPTDGDSAALDASALTPCSSLSNPYSSSDGTTYNFDCNGINDIGPHSELIMSYTTGRAFSECMDLCSTTAGCVASTYFPSANASNNECYLYKSLTTSSLAYDL